MKNKYQTIIGLEVHIEPNTKTKMFCRCPQDHFGKEPNTQTCPVCLGLPGALPYANEEGILKTVKLGLALGSKISKKSRFYRKNYFYPDLPKGFQTSQLDSPFCIGGELLGKKINHIHLEEDAGKLVHETINGEKYSLIDFNRSGCALIELVTEPVFQSIDEVVGFLKELQLIARYLNISNADMEKGTMRLEANISLSKDGTLPDYRVELKNINSFKFLDKALSAEIKRQSEALDNGEKLVQETRGFDEAKQSTFSQRTKSDAHDYKYFPEADLPPVKISESQIKDLRSQIPEHPDQKRSRYEQEFKLSDMYISVLVSDFDRANYFETAVELKPEMAKEIANVMVNQNLDKNFPEPAGLVKKLIELSKKEFASDADSRAAVEEVIKSNQGVVKKYQDGQTNVLGFFIGQVQKELKGKGDPKLIAKLLTSNLQSN